MLGFAAYAKLGAAAVLVWKYLHPGTCSITLVTHKRTSVMAFTQREGNTGQQDWHQCKDRRRTCYNTASASHFRGIHEYLCGHHTYKRRCASRSTSLGKRWARWAAAGQASLAYLHIYSEEISLGVAHYIKDCFEMLGALDDALDDASSSSSSALAAG